MSRYAKVESVLHEIAGRYAKVDGVWRTVTARYVKQNGVWKQVYSSGKKLSDLSVGSLLKINENGVPQQYIIVNQGNPDTSIYDASCAGTWVLRKDIYANYGWGISYAYPQKLYENSHINSFLNSTFLAFFDSNIQSKMVQSNIPYYVGDSGYTLRHVLTKVFLLSAEEVGYIWNSTEGSKLSYFESTVNSYDASGKRVATLNSTPTYWWLRTCVYSANRAWIVKSDGSLTNLDFELSYGVRPAMILDPVTLCSSSPDSDNCYTLQ